MIRVDPAGWIGGLAALLAGGVAAVALQRLAGGWLAAFERELAAMGAGQAPAARRVAWLPAAVLGAVVVAAWGWEVVARGLEPLGAGGPLEGPAWAPSLRWLAHSFVLWFLAAATWIDLRHRVIPDWITVPGVVVGLLAAWVVPDMLLPVAVEVPRPFATPRLEWDVLGAAGGLRAAAPGWSPAALAAALGMFAAWWWIVTAPSDPADDHPGEGGEVAAVAVPPHAAFDAPRLALLAVGVATIAGAWWWGGIRFAALQAALAGMAVGGGVVWSTRAGASAAMGREAMGMGDVTLMAMVGTWIGWQACILACFVGVLVGLVHGVARLAFREGNELPFGPALCLGAVLVVAAWRPVWEACAAAFSEPLLLAAVLVSVIVGTALSLLVWTSLPDRARLPVLAVVVALLGALVGWLWVLGGPGAG